MPWSERKRHFVLAVRKLAVRALRLPWAPGARESHLRRFSLDVVNQLSAPEHDELLAGAVPA
eukprot:2608059-Lingulodinium_polyedra.AAC.1